MDARKAFLTICRLGFANGEAKLVDQANPTERVTVQEVELERESGGQQGLTKALKIYFDGDQEPSLKASRTTA